MRPRPTHGTDMSIAPRTRIDLGLSAVVVVVGIVFVLEALRIDPASYEAVGPRAVPLFLAGSTIALGLAIGLAAWWRADATPPSPGIGFAESDLRRVALMLGAGAAYAVAFWALGYMVATMLGMALALWVFGVRSPAMLIAMPIAAGLLYQIVFMGFMGLLDPRGALLDLRALSTPVTPG